MKKSIYFFLIITFICSNSYGYDWKLTATSDDDKDEYYLDIQSIKKAKGNVRYLVLINYTGMLVENVYSAIAHLEGDCYLSEIRVLSDKYYSGQMGNGEIVGESDIPDKDMTKFPEDTVFGTVLKEACNLLD